MRYFLCETVLINNKGLGVNLESKVDQDTKKRRIPDVSIQDYFGIILRGKWIIFFTLIAVTLAAFLYTRFADPVYKASASILINTKMAQPAIFLDVLKRWESDKNFTQNELEILKSTSLASEVAQRLLDRKYLDSAKLLPILIIQPKKDEENHRQFATVDEIVGKFEKTVDFAELPETDVIQIIAKSKNATEAALIANTIAQAYYDRNIRGSRAKSQSFREFLEVQLVDKRRALSESEDSLQSYMDRHGIVSLDDESRKLIDQLANLESQRDETNISIQSLTKMLASYQEQIPEQQKTVAKAIGDANDPYIRLLQEQLAKLEVQRDVTVAQNPTITEKEIYSKKISEIDEQIKSLRTQLQKRTNEFLGNLLPGSQTGTETAAYLKQVIQRSIETKMELQTLEAKKKALNDVLATYEKQFGQLPGKNIRFARLQRAKLSNEKLYITIQEKYNDAVMTEQSQFGYVEIIDPATVPDKPSSPKVFLIHFLGLVLGFVLGVVIVFVKERLDLKIQSPEDLKREGLTIRGTIVQMKNGIKPNKENPLLGLSQPFSPVAEAFKHLRTNLQYVVDGKNIRSLLITSSRPGEGKTTILANLAIAFGQLGKKVLAVDADLRKPTLYTFFEGKIQPGLTEFLLGQSTIEEIIQPTRIENVYLVSSGGKSRSSSELISSAKMQKFLIDMQSEFDLVLLDSPPVLAGTEPTILSTLTDQVIVVVSAGETRFGELLRTIEELAEPQGKTPGVVLNKFNLYRAYGIPYGRSGYGYYPYASKS